VEALDLVNGYIDITEPWKKDGEELDIILNDLVHSIIKVNILISPYLVDSSKLVFKSFIDSEKATFDDWDINIENKKLEKVENLFMRIK
jgi:methionyl-tRNA synthetase